MDAYGPNNGEAAMSNDTRCEQMDRGRPSKVPPECGAGGHPAGAQHRRGAPAEPVTPAGYHRGQNPTRVDQICTQAPFDPSPIPLSILDEITRRDEPGVVVRDEIGFDTLTLTGKGSGHNDALELLAAHGFGPHPRDKGTNWYRQGFDIEGGGIVAWDHRTGADSWMVEISGKQWMRDHERTRRAMFELSGSLPVRRTRLDIRRDQFGKELTLIDNVSASCSRGELCRVKTFDEMDRHLAKNPKGFVGRGYYLGSRQSERFVRVYDKGLERGWGLAGWWERFEAQLRGDLAQASWFAVVAAAAEWPRTAFDHLIGVVDFRVPVARHAKVGERERPGWWAAFCEGRSGVRTSSIREETDAARFLRWVRTAVMPTLEAVREGVGAEQLSDVVQAFEVEFRSVRPGGSPLAVTELIELFAGICEVRNLGDVASHDLADATVHGDTSG
ncbi:MAG: hypothetical protein DHS20C14_01610 [Phycisphaeraceae bacterium]|nr:MAG: hypothetical protein DHS20C14_01610 [Phycisphaeraceae bacterium]